MFKLITLQIEFSVKLPRCSLSVILPNCPWEKEHPLFQTLSLLMLYSITVNLRIFTNSIFTWAISNIWEIHKTRFLVRDIQFCEWDPYTCYKWFTRVWFSALEVPSSPLTWSSLLSFQRILCRCWHYQLLFLNSWSLAPSSISSQLLSGFLAKVWCLFSNPHSCMLKNLVSLHKREYKCCCSSVAVTFEYTMPATFTDKWENQKTIPSPKTAYSLINSEERRTEWERTGKENNWTISYSILVLLRCLFWFFLFFLFLGV